jgi:transcriptional regulator with XRE-family HTH domain
MGRPTKNASHVLVRLRKAISTDELTVTREILGERVGISASTIRDIETGRFRLTEAIAQRIMLATGVSTRSLLNGEDPLKDYSGRILTAESAMPMELYYQEEVSLNAMVQAALAAAKKKKRSAIFKELFWEWLPQAIAAIGATAAMKALLNRNLGVFDPSYVPEAFQPKNPKMKARWDKVRFQLVKLAIARADSEVGENTNNINANRAHREAEAKAYQEILSSGELRDKLSAQERKRT